MPNENTSQLSKDSCSFLITAKVCSVPYFIGLGVVVLKLSIFSLIVAGLVNFQDPSNPLTIPPSVSTTVAISQFFSLLFTAASQDDVITSLKYMSEGYQQQMGDLFDTNKLKWIVGVAILNVTGAVGLCVQFMLIITSGEVVDLILNFTAVEFVSLLDNVAFTLAVAGFLGGATQKEALLISSSRIQYDIPKGQQNSPNLRVIFFPFSFFVLLSGWATIYALQVRGVFLPQFVVVQFDDTLSPEMGFYSGLYSLRNNPWGGQFNRINYWAEDGVGMFAYCKDIRSWTFSLEDYPLPCFNFLAKSSPTDSFDLSESGSDQWYGTADSSQPRYFPMNHLYLSVGCSRDSDCGMPGHGTCVNNRCVCSRNVYGIRCDYVEGESCELLEVESGTFSANGDVVPSEYQLLKRPNGETVKVFHHDVYTSIPGPDEDVAVIIYTGIRWILLYATRGLRDLHLGTRIVATRDDLVEYFDSGNFTPELSLKRIEFMSEQVFFNTASDKATPKGLQWSTVRGDSPAAIEFVGVSNAVLLCVVCNNATNPCLNDNVCINGTCACMNGRGEGRLCQITPLGNGRCDPYFNEKVFSFDGGDCCEATCVSTPEHACGMQKYGVEGSLESANIGFPSCSDDAIVSGKGAAWATKSFDIPFLCPRQKGIIVLSANGRIVVAAEPTLDVVRVFDQVDSRWEQRGPLLEGPRMSHYGRKIALSTPPGAVAGRLLGKVPVYLAIAYRGDTHAAVNVVFWHPNDENWGSLPELHVCENSYRKSCDIQSIGIAQSGLGVTLAIGLIDGTISTYTNIWIGDAPSWKKTGEVDGTFVTMSGKGDLLAVRSPNRAIVDIYNYHFGSDPELSPYGSLNVSESSQLLELAGTLDHIRLSYDGSILGVAINGRGENDYLAVFSLDAGGLIRSKGWTMTNFASLSEEDVAKGLSSVVFSGDGSAAAVRVNTSKGPIRRLYQYRFEFGWNQLGPDFCRHAIQDLDADFSISHDGAQLAYADVGHASIFELIPRCNGNETIFRLSITHDNFPSYVTWTLENVENVGNLKVKERVLRACSNCYNDTGIYGRTNIVENVCIANDSLSCLRFTLQNEMGFQPGAGFAAFLGSREVARYDGIGTLPIIWMPDEASLVCGSGIVNDGITP